jgi:DNA polymerase-3 subunit beta
MKFQAQRETLLKPIQAVIGVVERRQTMPILANMWWQWQGGAFIGERPRGRIGGPSGSRGDDAGGHGLTQVLDIIRPARWFEGQPVDRARMPVIKSGKSRFTLSTCRPGNSRA